MKSLALYNPVQLEQIQEFIYDTFGGEEDGLIAHELTSEYVHTDVQIVAPEGDNRVFVTFGMGAREMNAPHPDLAHVELIMCASKDLDIYSGEAMTIINELVSLSKFPFRENTWLHQGHTTPASDAFREAFGFDAFAFISVDCTKIDGIGEVNFLLTIPIHKEEREWIMETDAFEGHLILEEVFGNQLYFADSGRNAFIPDEQTIQELKEFLQFQRENL